MSEKIKTKAIILIPVTPSEVPNGSFFLDSSNGNAPAVKGTNGNVQNMVDAGASLFSKQMQAGGAFGTKVPLSKRLDGRVVAADSDAADGQKIIGYSMEPSPSNGTLINVLTIGANVEGALTGLGFSPGQEVYLSETGGYTTDPNSFTGSNDSIIRVGIADCAAGAASSVVPDLIVFTEVILRPITP